MKIVGAILIVFGGCLFGAYKVNEEKKKLKCYNLLISVVFDTIELIKYRKLKTDEIITKLHKDERYTVFLTLKMFYEEFIKSSDISYACERSFIDDRNYPYERELYKIIKVIGRDSEETQIEKLLFLKSEMQRSVIVQNEEYAKNKKLYITLSFGVSFILAIMLI